jgi:uncharacterized protein (DUF1499 family)
MSTTDGDGGEAPGRLGAGGFGRFVRVFLLPALLGALVSTAVLYVPAAGWSTNDVTTGKHPGYPDLQPRLYDSTVENATLLAAAGASRIPRWKVVRTVPQQGVMEAQVRTAIPLFTDDVTVTVTPAKAPDGQPAAEVTIRSRSRVGGGDLGENARHIRALQAAMDAKLPRIGGTAP